MVRCGFVCCCMFDWLVGFHNLILLVDFRWIFTTFVVVWISGTSAWADMRILEVFHLVVNSFCDELR